MRKKSPSGEPAQHVQKTYLTVKESPGKSDGIGGGGAVVKTF